MSLCNRCREAFVIGIERKSIAERDGVRYIPTDFCADCEAWLKSLLNEPKSFSVPRTKYPDEHA